MKELYAIKSTQIYPEQIAAFLEFTKTPDLQVFHMWTNPDIPLAVLHPWFKFWATHNKTDFNNEETLSFIRQRVFEPGYDGIDAVLEKVGIPVYDAWEIFKAYKGRHVKDDLEAELIGRSE